MKQRITINVPLDLDLTMEFTKILSQELIDQVVNALRVRPIPLVGDDGDVVLPFMEWIKLAGLAEITAREMRSKGEGPRFVKLTNKKLGVTLAEHRRWLKSRMEAR